MATSYTIRVTDADGDGVWVASGDFTLEYGAGDTPLEAVKALLDNAHSTMQYLSLHEGQIAGRLQDETISLRHFAEGAD